MKVIDNQSMSASFESDPIDISGVKIIGVQAYWSGSLITGTMGIAVSIGSDGIFTDLPAEAKAIPGNSGSVVWNLAPFSYDYIKFTYTKVLGTGNMTVNMELKN